MSHDDRPTIVHQLLRWPTAAEKTDLYWQLTKVQQANNFLAEPLTRSTKNIAKVVGATSTEGFLVSKKQRNLDQEIKSSPLRTSGKLEIYAVIMHTDMHSVPTRQHTS